MAATHCILRMHRSMHSSSGSSCDFCNFTQECSSLDSRLPKPRLLRASVRVISLRQSNKKARSTPDTIPALPSSDDRSGPDDDGRRTCNGLEQTDRQSQTPKGTIFSSHSSVFILCSSILGFDSASEVIWRPYRRPHSLSGLSFLLLCPVSWGRAPLRSADWLCPFLPSTEAAAWGVSCVDGA